MLDLEVNKRLTGSIPDCIGNLTELRKLSLSNNNLTGPIPDGMTALKKLTLLGIGTNRLAGRIPAALFEIRQNGGVFSFCDNAHLIVPNLTDGTC